MGCCRQRIDDVDRIRLRLASNRSVWHANIHALPRRVWRFHEPRGGRLRIRVMSCFQFSLGVPRVPPPPSRCWGRIPKWVWCWGTHPKVLSQKCRNTHASGQTTRSVLAYFKMTLLARLVVLPAERDFGVVTHVKNQLENRLARIGNYSNILLLSGVVGKVKNKVHVGPTNAHHTYFPSASSPSPRPVRERERERDRSTTHPRDEREKHG